MNYFNYFTEIEEHFQRARQTGTFLLSPLDWALIEVWKDSGVPLEAALKGIDRAFEKWHARKRRARMVNALAYCSQEVLSAAREMSGESEPQSRKAQAAFSPGELAEFFRTNAALVRQTGAPLLIHTTDAPMIETSQPQTFGFDLPWEPSQPTALLEEGSAVTLGDLTFTVLHTPGHTPGGICLLADEHDVLISGDTLFAGTYGRVDLPGAEPDLMIESLHRLATLSPTLTVHPGHGRSTTIAAERDWIANL